MQVEIDTNSDKSANTGYKHEHTLPTCLFKLGKESSEENWAVNFCPSFTAMNMFDMSALEFPVYDNCSPLHGWVDGLCKGIIQAEEEESLSGREIYFAKIATYEFAKALGQQFLNQYIADHVVDGIKLPPPNRKILKAKRAKVSDTEVTIEMDTGKGVSVTKSRSKPK